VSGAANRESAGANFECAFRRKEQDSGLDAEFAQVEMSKSLERDGVGEKDPPEHALALEPEGISIAIVFG
jgi:hypothetical protein